MLYSFVVTKHTSSTMIRAATASQAHRLARRVAVKGSRRPITSGLTAVENKVSVGESWL